MHSQQAQKHHGQGARQAGQQEEEQHPAALAYYVPDHACLGQGRSRLCNQGQNDLGASPFGLLLFGAGRAPIATCSTARVCRYGC